MESKETTDDVDDVESQDLKTSVQTSTESTRPADKVTSVRRYAIIGAFSAYVFFHWISHSNLQ